MKIIQIGNLRKGTPTFDNPQTGRVYSAEGLSPTLNTCQGGERQPKVLVKVKNMEKIVCERRMDEGLRTFKDGAVGIIRTICAGGDKRVVENSELDNEYRIRKLTPKECWRLMGFSDDAFEKAKSSGVSDTQLYKQAGNSIVTDVLYYIFKELYNVMPYLFDDLKVGSYFSGIGAFEIGLDRLYADINNENFIQPQTV